MQNNLPKILIIDDNEGARLAIEGLLSLEPYELYFATDGSEGIAMAVSIHPDVILLDVMMPKMDGFELCRLIRSTPEVATVPVIFITSLDDQNSRMQGLRAGADDFVAKPYNKAELFTRLQTILRLNRYRRLAEQQEELETLHNELVDAYNKTIEGWSRALDLRDRETEGHTQRVTELTMRLAEKMDLSPQDMIHIRRGALLHDIGKLGVPDHILLKPGKLTTEEWRIMRQHPVFAYELLLPIAYLRQALNIPYCHHERWDGTGYPRGLKGEEIPLMARIFAVVDVWDAITSDRPYRTAWSKEQAIAHISKGAGTHFDPQVVEAFVQLLECKSN